MDANVTSRSRAIVLAAALVGVGLLMARVIDSGYTEPWSRAARNMWATSTLVVSCAGLATAQVLVGYASRFADPGPPSVATFLTVFWGSAIASLGLMIGLEVLYGVPPARTCLLCGGTLSLLGAMRWPDAVFQTLRRIAWFGLIEEDRTVRVLMASAGAFFVASGIWTSNEALMWP